MIQQLYQSLGNRFIITDTPPSSSPDICKKYRVDGVLVANTDTHQVTIINADGSPGQLCINGLRCIAQMLNTSTTTLHMAGLTIPCQKSTNGDILMQLPPAMQIPHPITHDFKHAAYLVAPNPHLLLEQPLPENWQEFAAQLCTDARFANGCNITLYQRINESTVKAWVYERGVGPTPACGSAALALGSYLLKNSTTKLKIIMPGGITSIWQEKDKVFLAAKAALVTP